MIYYVSSSRDLLSSSSASTATNWTIFADPDYGPIPASAPARVHTIPLRSAGWENLDYFEPRRGTAAEAQQIQKLLHEHRLPVTVYTKRLASEAALHQIHSPHVLHLATHGFFLSAVSTRTVERGAALNPMLLSGLALANANQTIQALRNGQPQPAGNDGLLTAEKVATLDLAGTWLVTLSACETGVGVAVSGEGVLGLRRGFALAGAENLLLTLWPVRDQDTATFMASFYKEALLSADPTAALTTTQRKTLERLRRKSLANAVSVAGPFILSGRAFRP